MITHTSVAVAAAERFIAESGSQRPMVVVSTASPYKFAGDVLLSLTGKKPCDDLDAPALLEAETHTEMPAPLKSALGMTPIHLGVIDKEDMKSSVTRFLKKA